MREIEPTRVTQGEEIEWTREFADFPASLYTLAYRFRGPGVGFDVAATADGDKHHAELESAQSQASKPGKWIWQAWVTEIADSDHVAMIASGYVQILQGYAAGSTAAIDLRTPNKIMLETLDAALLKSGDILEYDVTTPAGGRKVRRQLRSEVLNLRKYYATLVAQENARERARMTGSFGTAVKVRFTENG